MKTGQALFWCAVGAFAGSCGDSASTGDGDAILIGMLATKSGELAEWGRQMERSAQFAVTEINDAGGFDGRKLKLIVEDTQGDPDSAVALARELIDEGVVALLGPGTSAEAVAVVEQVTRELGMPMISPGATSPLLTTIDDGDTFFRTIASDAFQGRVLARRIYADGARTLGLIYRDDAYGVGLDATIQEEFEMLGGTMAEQVPYHADKVMSFGSEVARLFPDGKVPDAVALLSFHEDGANITRDIRTLGLATLPRFYGVDGTYSQDFAESGAPDVVDGLVGTASVADQDDPNFVAARTTFAELTGQASDFDGGSYDAVYLVAYAFAAAREATSRAVIENVRQVTRPDSDSPTPINAQEWAKGSLLAREGKDIDYDGASGPADLDQNGDTARGFFAYWEVQVDGDGARIVENDGTDFP
jgi:ABC-type branched-subunit amino acid transport system substrate-binding protein